MPRTAAAQPPITPRLAERDRFLAFAFAAAEILVETGPEGSIIWAGGAFPSRLGAPAEAFLGRPVHTLVAPADRLVLAHALAIAAMQGRLGPTVIRLADAANTACALGALALPGAAGRLCLTFAALPSTPPPPPSAVQDGATLGREAEAALRSGQPATLGLFDLTGWDAPNSPLSASARHSLSADIAAALLSEGGQGTMVTEMAEGRFGVLGTEALDIPRLVAAIETLVKLAPVGGGIRVRGQQLDLATHPTDEGYSGRATRALRYALACFAKNGLTGLADAGFRDGLEGFLATAAQRAAALGARIAGRRFRLVYQPVVNLSDRAVHHFEALIRPLADLDGLALSPQDFVTYAEAINLSEPLDLAIVSEVRATLAEAPREVRVAANISGLSMQSASFRDQLMAQVPRDGRLLVELTETADITDTDAAAATIAALRQAQVEVGIDDFGAGSASFRYVRDFRVDHVKIDGSYVRAATQGARERGLVASMRDLAHGLGADTIAEMIETEETAGLMRELGVTFGQGYLFGRAGRLPGSRRD